MMQTSKEREIPVKASVEQKAIELHANAMLSVARTALNRAAEWADQTDADMAEGMWLEASDSAHIAKMYLNDAFGLMTKAYQSLVAREESDNA